MLSTLTKWFAANPATPAAADDGRAAMAALLVEAARRDNDYAPAEQAAIDAVLMDAFSLDPAAAAALRAEGEAAQSRANDIQQFTRVIKDAVPYEERGQFLERVWRVVLADDHRDPEENAFMRKLCGLLYVEDRDNNRARQRAMAASKAGD